MRANGEEVQRNLTKVGSRRESFISSEPKLGSVFQSRENADSDGIYGKPKVMCTVGEYKGFHK